MTNIRQFNIGYVPEQDRLLLRLNTTDRTEFQLWLTRRMAKVLGARLAGLVSADPQVVRQADASARKAVASFQRERRSHGPISHASTRRPSTHDLSATSLFS